MIEQQITRYLALVDLVNEMGPTANPLWYEEIATFEKNNPSFRSSSNGNGHNGHTPPPSDNPPPPPKINGHARAATPTIPGGRVPVVITNDTEKMIDQVLQVLGKRYCVFQNAGKLLELQIDPGKTIKFLARQINNPRMVEIDATRAWSIANRECVFGKVVRKKGGDEHIEEQLPPDRLGSMIVRLPQFPHIPILSALAQAPTLRMDGALIHEHGYDESTGIFLANEDLKVDISENLTHEDAKNAYARVVDYMCDYKFTNPAGKDVWVAGLLSVVCRHTFDGPVPLFIFDAVRRGLGKSTLADLISIVATGSECPRMFYSDNTEEMDKRISSLGIAGDQLVLIDNIVGKLGSPPLDAALTSTSYKGRVLGQNKMTPALSMKIVWFATGNGIIIGADTARRSLIAKIYTNHPHPEDRTGPEPGKTWKYNPIIECVKRNRATILSDALTVVSAFIQSGRPSQKLLPMGSFDGWSNTIRNAVVWAGGLDPCSTIGDVREADLDDLALRMMVQNWPVADDVEVTAASLIDWAKVEISLGLDPEKRAAFEHSKTIRETWRNALLEWLPAKRGDLPTAKELGYALRGIAGAVVENRRIEAVKNTSTGTAWRRTKINNEIRDEKRDEFRDEKSLLSVVR